MEDDTALMTEEQPLSQTRLLPVFLLCFFFGLFGLHRLYLGKIATGILQLLTLGVFGIWTLVDLILMLVGRFKDKQGNPLTEWT